MKELKVNPIRIEPFQSSGLGGCTKTFLLVLEEREKPSKTFENLRKILKLSTSSIKFY